MKLSLAAFVAVPLLALSSVGFADDSVPAPQETSAEPMMLSMNEMDAVTAGASINIGNIQLALNINTVVQTANAFSVFGNATAVNVSRIVNANRFRFAPR
jgi:hypothetical protein